MALPMCNSGQGRALSGQGASRLTLTTECRSFAAFSLLWSGWSGWSGCNQLRMREELNGVRN